MPSLSERLKDHYDAKIDSYILGASEYEIGGEVRRMAAAVEAFQAAEQAYKDAMEQLAHPKGYAHSRNVENDLDRVESTRKAKESTLARLLEVDLG